MPVPAVDEEVLPDFTGGGPVVVELFSSQACVFCPRADRLFADLVQQENVIGIACHVDYFDVAHGSLSRPFCTERQSRYMELTFAGPNYTPQMVINGAYDIPGYRYKAVAEALRKAAQPGVALLGLEEAGSAGTYRVILPEGLAVSAGMRLWVALYDKPHVLTIAEGRNKGQQASYYHIVSVLGGTDRLQGDIYVTPRIEAGHEGFVLILQDMDTGRILAAAQRKVAE